MIKQPARILAWLADLAAINAEIENTPLPSHRPTPKRARKRRPLWEE